LTGGEAARKVSFLNVLFVPMVQAQENLMDASSQDAREHRLFNHPNASRNRLAERSDQILTGSLVLEVSLQTMQAENAEAALLWMKDEEVSKTL